MEEDVLTKEEVMRRLREGTPVERLKGIANVLGENVIGGYIEDYESPGEKLGAGIDAYAQALFKNPVETIKGTATNFADTIKAVATPSYDETGMPVVTRDQALQALSLAGGTAGTGAVASGTRLADLGKLDPAIVRMAGTGRDSPFSTEDIIRQLHEKNNNQKIDNIIKVGREKGATSQQINNDVLVFARQNGVPHPKRAFDNPKVEYVNTATIADTVAQFNLPRYRVGEFGGEFESGNLNEMPQVLEEFKRSGRPTLKEDIYNVGIEEPIEIEVVLENGQFNIGQGHHRLQAAIELGIPEVPVIIKTKQKPRGGFPVFQPGEVDLTGIPKESTDYSFSEFNLIDRITKPKETAQEAYRRGGTDYMNQQGEFSDRPFPEFTVPMREQFVRKPNKPQNFANGGGVASLNEIARGMFR